MVNKKPSLGRQKIAMERITKKNHLQVTFSKRRAGLFKKASELCTLCGVEIAIVVFSPASKPFSFGHPEVEPIFHRFLTRNAPPQDSSARQFIEAHRSANVRELNMHLTQLLTQLEAEKKRGEALDQLQKATRSRCWWAAPIEELDLNELEQLKGSLEELKKNIAKQANRIVVESTNINNPSKIWGLNAIGHVNNAAGTKPIDQMNVGSAFPQVYNGYAHTSDLMSQLPRNAGI